MTFSLPHSFSLCLRCLDGPCVSGIPVDGRRAHAGPGRHRELHQQDIAPATLSCETLLRRPDPRDFVSAKAC